VRLRLSDGITNFQQLRERHDIFITQYMTEHHLFIPALLRTELIWQVDNEAKMIRIDAMNKLIEKLENFFIANSDILTAKIGKGYIETAILINLPKSKKIKPHTDAHIYFDSRNRIHIPIVTNDMCIFEVDGEEINMKQGEIWEINNSDKPHSVINNGETDRIHLLIDWKVIDKNNSKKSKTLL